MKLTQKIFVLCALINFSQELQAELPSFKLDPKFVYLSGDVNSLLNLRYYPSIKAEYEKVFANLRKGLETPAEGLILMNLAYSLGDFQELQRIGKFVLKKDSRADEARLLMATAATTGNQPDLAEFLLDQITDKSLDGFSLNLM